VETNSAALYSPVFTSAIGNMGSEQELLEIVR